MRSRDLDRPESMNEGQVVDAHFHIWDLERLFYSGLSDEMETTHVMGDYSRIRRTYLLEEYLANARPCRVQKAVHVQAAIGHPDPVEETAWVHEVSLAANFPVAIIGYADLREPSCGHVLEAHMKYPGFRGIRMLSQPGLFDDQALHRGMRTLSDLGLIFDLDVDLSQMRSACKLVSAFPEVQFVLNHVGFPKQTDPTYFRQWQQAIAELALAPNVACKLSGLSMIYHEPSAECFRPWVRHAWNLFGAKRCLFGSNWPVDGLFSDFPTILRSYLDALGPITDEDREAFLVRNACRVFRL